MRSWRREGELGGKEGRCTHCEQTPHMACGRSTTVVHVLFLHSLRDCLRGNVTVFVCQRESPSVHLFSIATRMTVFPSFHPPIPPFPLPLPPLPIPPSPSSPLLSLPPPSTVTSATTSCQARWLPLQSPSPACSSCQYPVLCSASHLAHGAALLLCCLGHVQCRNAYP